ncbi:MAG: sensor domain-containing diguanylate cyclase, partial [Deltaproteobacteria bacterium]|nr:sensor domain-containing diguanylate cyclase [Deltaproteobacteria bacterium]
VLNHPLMAGVKNRIADLKDMSILIVPIVFNDEVLGTLFLRTRKKENGFSQKEIDFCRIVANSSFHALRNARLFEKVTKEKEYLKEIAVKDQLTSLYNHNFFYSRLEEEFERAVRYETPLSLIMLDIDNFKQINDTFGHRVGDVVLREIAAMVKRGVRKTDIVARYGGEEFAVILPHTLLKGAVDEAERLREIVESHAYAGLVSNKITVSIGVASYPQKGAMNSGDLVNYADDALYKAKWSGKNCVKVAET